MAVIGLLDPTIITIYQNRKTNKKYRIKTTEVYFQVTFKILVSLGTPEMDLHKQIDEFPCFTITILSYPGIQ